MLSAYQANGLGLWVRYSSLVRQSNALSSVTHSDNYHS